MVPLWRASPGGAVHARAGGGDQPFIRNRAGLLALHRLARLYGGRPSEYVAGRLSGYQRLTIDLHAAAVGVPEDVKEQQKQIDEMKRQGGG